MDGIKSYFVVVNKPTNNTTTNAQNEDEAVRNVLEKKWLIRDLELPFKIDVYELNNPVSFDVNQEITKRT